MRTILSLCFALISYSVIGQDKLTEYVAYRRLIEMTGTEYVLAAVQQRTKVRNEGEYLLFINTKTGENLQVNIPPDSYIEKIEQIKLDTLQINRVVVSGRMVNLNNDKSIDYYDPEQIMVLSTDGKEQIKITPDNYFVSSYAINRQTGVIVVTGHVDSNNNKKWDRTDKNEIFLYDLKALKLVAKL